ncbi:MAG: hypothetical protein LBB67_01840, partial [Oscillospiraceae bacterium]|nr:hypothetical protein [Oscillospiraceae bacterium]
HQQFSDAVVGGDINIEQPVQMPKCHVYLIFCPAGRVCVLASISCLSIRSIALSGSCSAFASCMGFLLFLFGVGNSESPSFSWQELWALGDILFFAFGKCFAARVPILFGMPGHSFVEDFSNAYVADQSV